MITIDNVISIDDDVNFAGSQELDPASIVYARPNPADDTQTLLYEDQKGAFKPRWWLIDETLANVVSNAVTDSGWEVLLNYAAVEFEGREVDYNIALNPARIFYMTNVNQQAVIRFWADDIQGLTDLTWVALSATVAAAANNTLQQIESSYCDCVNELPLADSATIYYATVFVDKVVPARTGAADYSTPEQVFISTYNSNKMVLTVDASGSSS